MSKRIDYAKLSPSATHALYALEKAVAELGIEPTIKFLVKIRASQLNGCLLCLDMHVKEARKHGEQELRLHHLSAWRESALFNEKEKAALEWTEVLTQPDTEGASDDDYENAQAHFSEKELSDLTFAIATINAWNRLGIAFRAAPGSMDKIMGLENWNK